MKDLPDAIAAAVGSLGEAHIEALVDAYRSAGPFTTAQAAKTRQAVPAPHHGDVDRLNLAWAAEPNLAGDSIAVALKSVQSAQRLADTPIVEVVVTGPDSPATPVRLTSEVGPPTHRPGHPTRHAGELRGVSAAVRLSPRSTPLSLEASRSASSSSHRRSSREVEAANAYAKFRTYHWPIDRRDPPEAKLHAKAVIIDSRNVLLTSANMTSAAYDKNIELGVLCSGGGVAQQVQRHFDALVARGVLERVP